MSENGEGLHLRGKFAWINGVEVPVFGTMSAGTFGVPVESVSLREEDAPSGVTVLPYSGPLTPGVISIPRSEVSDLLMWDWFVEFEGEWYRVLNERDGQFLISTHWYSRAAADPGWEGDPHNGWDRWVSVVGARLQVVSYPSGAQPAAPKEGEAW